MENISIAAWLSLAVVLWFVYELGKLVGINYAVTELKDSVGPLIEAKEAAEAEAAECRVACGLFQAALSIKPQEEERNSK